VLNWINRVRKNALALLAVFISALIILLPSIAVAAEPNTGAEIWSLDSKNDRAAKLLPASVSRMEKDYGKGDNGQSGAVTISGGSSYIWVSDQITEADVTISSGAWILQIVTDSDWGAKGSNCQIEIGEWNGAVFNSLTPPPQNLKSRVNSKVIIKTLFQSNSLTIHKGKYLAVRVNSLEKTSKKHIIFTGEGAQTSYLRSPETFAVTAVPELASGMLLALGLAGLGTFIVIRRKSARKSVST
jgi:hypothetical protein